MGGSRFLSFFSVMPPTVNDRYKRPPRAVLVTHIAHPRTYHPWPKGFKGESWYLPLVEAGVTNSGRGPGRESHGQSVSRGTELPFDRGLQGGR